MQLSIMASLFALLAFLMPDLFLYVKAMQQKQAYSGMFDPLSLGLIWFVLLSALAAKGIIMRYSLIFLLVFFQAGSVLYFVQYGKFYTAHSVMVLFSDFSNVLHEAFFIIQVHWDKCLIQFGSLVFIWGIMYYQGFMREGRGSNFLAQVSLILFFVPTILLLAQNARFQPTTLQLSTVNAVYAWNQAAIFAVSEIGSVLDQ